MKIKLSSIETTNDRTLFSLSDGNYSDVFSLFVDLNNKLNYSICGQEFTTDIYVSEEEWHNCSISKGENELVILFDNQSIISGNEFILNSEYLNIGHAFVMVNNKGKAINQLNGYVRDIMLANEYLTTVELGSIYDKLNKYIIERKKDGKVYITGQGVKENYVLKYENYKFGFTDINYAGCEIMAVYNMSVLLGLNWKMADLIYYFESKNLCFGFLGAFVTHLKQLLLMANINFDECYDVEELNTIFSNPKYKCYILTYWNDVQDLMGMLHTTFVNIINRYVSKNQKLYLLTDEEIELEGDLTIERKSANEKLYEVNGRDVPKINFDEILNKQLDGSYSKWLVSAFLIY